MVFAIFILVGILRSTPSEAVVRQEFVDRYPGSTIRNVELIFEQNGNVVCLITARERDESKEGKYDFPPLITPMESGSGVTTRQKENAKNCGSDTARGRTDH